MDFTIENFPTISAYKSGYYSRANNTLTNVLPIEDVLANYSIELGVDNTKDWVPTIRYSISSDDSEDVENKCIDSFKVSWVSAVANYRKPNYSWLQHPSDLGFFLKATDTTLSTNLSNDDSFTYIEYVDLSTEDVEDTLQTVVDTLDDKVDYILDSIESDLSALTSVVSNLSSQLEDLENSGAGEGSCDCGVEVIITRNSKISEISFNSPIGININNDHGFYTDCVDLSGFSIDNISSTLYIYIVAQVNASLKPTSYTLAYTDRLSTNDYDLTPVQDGDEFYVNKKVCLLCTVNLYTLQVVQRLCVNNVNDTNYYGNFAFFMTNEGEFQVSPGYISRNGELSYVSGYRFGSYHTGTVFIESTLDDDGEFTVPIYTIEGASSGATLTDSDTGVSTFKVSSTTFPLGYIIGGKTYEYFVSTAIIMVTGDFECDCECSCVCNNT